MPMMAMAMAMVMVMMDPRDDLSPQRRNSDNASIPHFQCVYTTRNIKQRNDPWVAVAGRGGCSACWGQCPVWQVEQITSLICPYSC